MQVYLLSGLHEFEGSTVIGTYTSLEDLLVAHRAYLDLVSEDEAWDVTEYDSYGYQIFEIGAPCITGMFDVEMIML